MKNTKDRCVERVDGVLLAGGAGRRVHGRDKGLLNVAGQPAALLIARRLAGCCERVFISANRNRQAYQELGVGPVIEDSRTDHAGPLAGLEAVRPLLREPLVLVAPCDMPDLRADMLSALLAALRADRERDAVYACSEEGNHYLLAALRRDALCGISQRLDAGASAVRHWLESLNSAAVPLTGSAGTGLRDRNTPRDWGGI